jgi:3',5'-cyclic-AMP phosphodiesterase
MINSEPIKRRTFLATLAGIGATMFLPIRRAEAQAFKPFSFAFVTDCHLITRLPDSFKLTQESQLFLQDAIKQINGLSPDFVLFGGDQVDSLGLDEVNWQLFIDIAQTLNCPWSFILGERDVSGTVPPDKLRTYARDWRGKGLDGDKSYWSQDVMSGVHLIGLDTSRANTTMGDLSSEQLAWLQQDLDSHKRGIIIVASHHPLLPPAPYDGGPPWDECTVPQGATAREILNSSHNVRLALSGHVFVSKIEREKDIWYVSNPGLDVFPCAFRFFRVDGNGITVETYQVDFPALIKKARVSLAASPIALHYNSNHPAAFLNVVEGSREDQNAHLPFTRNVASEAIKRRNPPKQAAPEPSAKKGKKHKRFFQKDKQEETEAPEVSPKKPTDLAPQPREATSGGSGQTSEDKSPQPQSRQDQN